MLRDTGSPRADAETRLPARPPPAGAGRAGRAGCSARTATTARRCRSRTSSDALGLVNEVSLGIQVIPVDHIVGSVDKVRDFDPKFRPSSGSSRRRWERIAEAARRGEPLPADRRLPDRRDVLRARRAPPGVGVPGAGAADHRGRRAAGADPRRADDVHAHSDLSDQELRRLLMQRVPLGKTARRTLRLSDPKRYPWLAEMVEAWSARLMFAEGTVLDPGPGRRALVRGGVRPGHRPDPGGQPAGEGRDARRRLHAGGRRALLGLPRPRLETGRDRDARASAAQAPVSAAPCYEHGAATHGPEGRLQSLSPGTRLAPPSASKICIFEVSYQSRAVSPALDVRAGVQPGGHRDRRRRAGRCRCPWPGRRGRAECASSPFIMKYA